LGHSPLPTSAPRLGSPRAHLHAETALTAATTASRLGSALSTSAPGPGSAPAHICTGTGLTPATSAPRLGLTLATSAPGLRSGHLQGAVGRARRVLERRERRMRTDRVLLQRSTRRCNAPAMQLQHATTRSGGATPCVGSSSSSGCTQGTERTQGYSGYSVKATQCARPWAHHRRALGPQQQRRPQSSDERDRRQPHRHRPVGPRVPADRRVATQPTALQRSRSRCKAGSVHPCRPLVDA
jgi:hypothetical protein